MEIREILWIEPFAVKIETKHHVVEDEVLDVFDNDPFINFRETGDVEGEDLYSAMGQTSGGRYLIVFFVYKTTKEALVISTREMTDSERRRYAKEKA